MKGESRRRAASKTPTSGGEGDGSRVASCGWVAGFVGDEVQAELDELEVPVAELAPEELVDGAGGFVEAIVVQRTCGLAAADWREAGEDPAGFNAI